MDVHGQSSVFANRVERLEKNVYGTTKGVIRLTLLKEDIMEYCPGFALGSLRILDIGGGSGHFAKICAERGNSVLLCDSSQKMIDYARERMASHGLEKNIIFLYDDFLAESCSFSAQFDLVLMHGSAEWMASPHSAIMKACSCVRPGGHLSLLVHNKDRLTLKRGINGMLVQETSVARKALTPPGSMSSFEIGKVLRERNGRALLQSGMRIFHTFFRHGVEEQVLSPEEWLHQERLYYRQEPFSRLGEHTHVIWQAGR